MYISILLVLLHVSWVHDHHHFLLYLFLCLFCVIVCVFLSFYLLHVLTCPTYILTFVVVILHTTCINDLYKFFGCLCYFVVLCVCVYCDFFSCFLISTFLKLISLVEASPPIVKCIFKCTSAFYLCCCMCHEYMITIIFCCTYFCVCFVLLCVFFCLFIYYMF